MNDPLVSIIIPVFNNALEVGRAIESALNQSHGNTEIILVDNNSTDPSLNILRDYQVSHPTKIKTYREMTQGAPAARNKGLKEASGEWIQFLDADDVLLPGKIAMQMALLQAHEADIVLGAYLYRRPFFSKEIKPLHNPWMGLLSSHLGRTSSMLWRREVLNAIGGWDEKMESSQEYMLLFKAQVEGVRLCFDDSVQTIVYKRDESVSHTKDKHRLYRVLFCRLNLRIMLAEYLKKNNMFDRGLQIAYDKYIYSQLILHRYSCPWFYNKYKHLTNVKIPLSYRLRRNTEAILKVAFSRLTGVFLG